MPINRTRSAPADSEDGPEDEPETEPEAEGEARTLNALVRHAHAQMGEPYRGLLAWCAPLCLGMLLSLGRKRKG